MLNKNEIIIANFLQYLRVEKQYSTDTIRAYKVDLEQFFNSLNPSFSISKISTNKLNKAINGNSYRVNHGFNFQLDEPEKYKSNGNNSRLRGWCFSIDGTKIINIRGKAGDKLVESQYLIERRELDYMFEPEDQILHSGFEFSFKLPFGSTSITIEAQMENTKWVTVTHLCLCKPLLFGKIKTIHE